MIVGGILPMILGRVVFFPLPNQPPPETPWGDNLTEPLIPYAESAALHSPLPALGAAGQAPFASHH